MSEGFSRSSDADQWLKGLSGESRVVCEGRCALRTLPHMAFGRWRGSDELAALSAFKEVLAITTARPRGNAENGQKTGLSSALEGLLGVETAASDLARNAMIHAAQAASHAASAAVGDASAGAQAAALAAGSAALAAEQSDLSKNLERTAKGLLASAAQDAALHRSGLSLGLMRASPIWRPNEIPFEIRSVWTAVQDQLLNNDPKWSFWREWYQGFLDGNPLDWELQRRVALIADKEWAKGAEHIANVIEEIQARLEVRRAADEVQRLLASLEVIPPGMGHNNPPDMNYDLPLQEDDLVKVEQVAESVLQQVKNEKPEKGILLTAVKWLGEIVSRVTIWVARKADMAIDVYVKVYATAFAVETLGQKPLIDRLVDFYNALKVWLSFLP